MPFLVRRARVGGRSAEPALVAALLLIAVVVRPPYLWDIPRFTDETAEAEIGLQIARGQSLPLTNRDPYIGSLWNWIVAAGFAVSGPSLFTPRLLIAVLGALTVVPTYLPARAWPGGTPQSLPSPRRLTSRQFVESGEREGEVWRERDEV